MIPNSAFEARNATVIRVVAEVARNYAVLRGLQLRVALLKENIARAEDNVKLTLSRFKQGLAAEGDNLLAQRELEALNATVPPLNSAIFDAVSRIGLLLGTYSGNVTVELRKPGALPHTPERVRPGSRSNCCGAGRTFGRLRPSLPPPTLGLGWQPPICFRARA